MYAAALGAPAVLVYPRADEDMDVTFEAGGNEVGILTIDLRCPPMAAISHFAEKLAGVMQTCRL